MDPELLKKRIEQGLKVGRDSEIYGYVEKYHPDWITIGKNVVFGDEGRIITHGPIRPYKENHKIVIEDLVWIGFRVIILPGVRIGKCSIIGAGSVVTKDVPPYHTAAGNPIKTIKKRKREEIERFFVTKWLMKTSPGKILTYDKSLLKKEHIEYVFGKDYEDFDSILDQTGT
jgi:acetyltransferase-like isoleucine patch superfamily enzyme